jgi:molybdate/tungstate transport system substrate-binding protein
MCGGSLSGPAPASAAGVKTPVDVFYAASLQDIMGNQVGPAFDKVTGDHFVGFPGGSKALATEIRGKLERADVFVSASPAVDASLMGKANGDWLSGYKVFGRTYLEIGYDPKSRFARELRSKPWYEVVGQPGFSLGRTDPSTDPKGVLAREALLEAARQHHLPALDREATESSDVFPEASLVGRVQSGQLDAGFFYGVEVVAAKLPAVRLSGYDLYATYTVAVVNRAAHPGAAGAFVAFLTGPKARKLMAKDGMQPFAGQ